MKIKLLTIALLAAVIGFGACGGGDDKSSDNTIKTFSVNGVAYTINSDNTIYHLYQKVDVGNWGEPPWPVAPTIELSSSSASISPLAKDTQNFIDNTVTYTVTAEDGSQRVYKVHAERAL